jgi:hypothetical protein
MKEVKQAIRRAIRRAISPYRVVIIDQDGDRYVHRARTTREARGWLGCYRSGIGIIYSRSGRMVALRIA